MNDFESEYRAFCRAHGTPDRVELLLSDLNAILRGKWLPGDQVDKLASGKVRLPISTYAPTIMGTEPPETGLGIVAGDPDGFMQPVPGSLKPVPWEDGNVAQVLVEMSETPGGDISGLSARERLRSVVDRFAAQGLFPVVATELEFYIFQPRDAGDQPPSPPPHLPPAQNYELDVLARFSDIMADIRRASEIQGLATDTLIAEFGPGQFEINFHHTNDILDAADTALEFRRLVRGIVARHGLCASFMAKPYAQEPGNGMHVHVSVLDETGRNIFDGPEKLKAAVAGVLATMRDAQLIFAPHMNSYRRFQPNSFAPSRPDWGHDNRAAAVRLPETSGSGSRLEHRISGADANPYLVLAAILGGVLHGLDHDIALPPPRDDPGATGIRPLDHDWAHALDRFSRSEFIEWLLGSSFRDILVAVKRDEIATITPEISPAEFRYYLGRL